MLDKLNGRTAEQAALRCDTATRRRDDTAARFTWAVAIWGPKLIDQRPPNPPAPLSVSHAKILPIWRMGQKPSESESVQDTSTGVREGGSVIQSLVTA